ncbi:MAG: hypothetical protein LBD07_00420 [Spirochaetaceae bacterium]|nr:hypothetical protein [Spirochaetaceae bacterium]
MLWEDLENIRTYGYQPHFNRATLKGESAPSNYIQGNTINSTESYHFAVQGSGFVKVAILGTNAVGYTRNGNFFVHSDLVTGKQSLLLCQKYTLADPIVYYMVRIKKDNIANTTEILEIFQSDTIFSATHGDTTKYETYHTNFYGPELARQPKIYDVPYNKLRHYQDGVYLL